jgi:hypothetical protein
MGIPLCTLGDFKIAHENKVFSNWFSYNNNENDLGKSIANINIERLTKRINKGRDYKLDCENKDGNRQKL